MKQGPLVRERPGHEAAAQARALQKRGDCKGALDLFDDAVRRSDDPSLRRDRGLCHEALGHPYPAQEDFRAYLYARPEAPDAEDIRARLARARAEEATTEPGPSPGAGTGDADLPKSIRGSASSAGGASGEGTGASARASFEASASASTGGSDETSKESATAGMTYDEVQAHEAKAEAANASALRRGRGFILGLYVDVRYWGEASLGIGQAIGLGLRYSLGPVSTLLLEAGYANMNGTDTSPSRDGAGVLLGYEARFRLDAYATHNLFVGGGFGYEHMNEGATGLVFATLLPRARFGYRAVLGPSLGLELGVDGGPAFLVVVDPPPGVSADATTWFVGLKTGVYLGF